MAIPPLVLRIVADSSGVKAGTAQAAAQVNGLRGKIQQNAGLIKGALIGAVVAVGVSSVKAFAESERVVEQLRITVGGATQAYEDQATALQQVTGFQDEAIISAQTLLSRFELTGDQVRAAIPTVLDYARAMGVDVETAASSVGKALLGNARALKSVGIDFTKTGDRAADFETILGGLEEKVGGSAEAFGETFAGQVAILETQIDELQESLGGALVPILGETVEALGRLTAGAKIAGEGISWLTERIGLSSAEAEEGVNAWDAFLLPFQPQNAPAVFNDVADSLEEVGRDIGILSRETMTGTSAHQSYEDSVRGVLDAFPSMATELGIVTDAQEAQNAAVEESIAITREAAGGLLGLIEASRTYSEAQKKVNRMQANGKEGTKEYRDAVTDLLTQRLELSSALDELRIQWKNQGVSLEEAKIALTQVGREAGLQGAALRRFIRRGLKPVNDELDQLVGGSPYTFEVRAVANFSQLQSKLAGLEARYDLGLGRAAGGPVSMGRPYVVGERGPELFVPSSAGTVVPNSGGGRTRREAAYLDRARFERDHAYSREYEGWR